MTWTIVRHSGYGYGDKPGFAYATETRSVTTERELKLVETAGGVLFEDYAAAEEFSEKANYPEGYEGLYPRVRGSFSARQIDGLQIYVPARQVIG